MSHGLLPFSHASSVTFDPGDAEELYKQEQNNYTARNEKMIEAVMYAWLRA